MKAFFCALLTLFVTQAYAKDIVVFGDSPVMILQSTFVD